MYDKLVASLKKRGVASTLKKTLSYFYKSTIRHLMPSAGYASIKNGIQTNEKIRKFGDNYLPDSFSPKDDSNPYYEYALCKNIRKLVNKKDTILIVGGGEGVTAAVAAQMVGRNGNVIVYEASKKMIKKIKNTIQINEIKDRVDIREGVVEEKISVRGHKEEASKRIIKPQKLPRCDVLELDCEGAELGILKKMKIEPRVILVETHGMYGSSTDKVKKILEKRGYDILSTEPAVVPDSPVERPDNFCVDNDIMVIAAKKR